MSKKRINIICFMILNIIVLLIFLPWIKGHYATDTYNIINVGYEHYSIHNSLIDGRIFMFLIMQFAAMINIKCELLSSILLCLALVVSNIAVMIIKNIVSDNLEKKNVKNEILSYIIAYTVIYNFMFLENLYFMECFVMAIAILLNLIAAKIFSQKGKKYLLKATVLILISVFCYQGTISSFIAFVILFETLKKQSLKQMLKNIIISIFLVGLVCICNFAFVKIISTIIGIQQKRLSNNILYNIVYIFKTKLKILVYTSFNFYYGIFLIYLAMLSICFICGVEFRKNKDKYFIFFVLLILGIIFCTDIPYVVSLTAFEAGRTRFAIGALCSIIVVYILKNFKEINEKYKKMVYKFLYCFMIMYCTLNIVNYVQIIECTKISNEYEKQYVQNIDKYINEYEIENNTVIEKIQLVYSEKANNAFYPNCIRKNVMTWNACSCSWSTAGVINFYSNRNLIPETSNIIRMKMDKMYEIRDNVLYIKIRVL